MRRSRFSEERSVGVLREHEAGAVTAAVYRQYGISVQTFYCATKVSLMRACSHRLSCPWPSFGSKRGEPNCLPLRLAEIEGERLD